MTATVPRASSKAAWFAQAWPKARIGDPELCAAIRECSGASSTISGGGVFKKRLDDNMHRSLILAKGGRNWMYAYLFAKKDRANISPDELVGFKKLAVGVRSHDCTGSRRGGPQSRPAGDLP